MPDDVFTRYDTEASPIMFPVSTRSVGWETQNQGYERVRSHKAIVRTDNGVSHVLAIVGSGYQVVHNHELTSAVQQILCKQMQSHQLADVIVHDRVSGWGRICLREYVFPNIRCLLGGSTRSTIAFRLIVQNGYGGAALRIHAGAIDFWCQNGIISGEYHSAYRKHTAGLVVSGIGDVVGKSLATFADSQELWKRWAAKPVQHQAAMDLFRELASTDRLRDNLQHQYLREVDARGHNMWSVYSALTYYASHADGEFKLRSTVQEQDTVASTMLQRELNVAKWVESPAWHKLELA